MYTWDIWEDDIVYIAVEDDMMGTREDMENKFEDLIWG